MMDHDEFVAWVKPYMQRLRRQIYVIGTIFGADPVVFLPVGTAKTGDMFLGRKVYTADVKVPMVGVAPDVRDE